MSVGIRAGDDAGDALGHVDDPLRPVVLGLERDDQVVARHQGGPATEVEVRRAVDHHEVVRSRTSSRKNGGSLELRVGQVRVGDVVAGRAPGAGDQVDPGDPGRVDDLLWVREVARVDGGDRWSGVDLASDTGPQRPWVSDDWGSLSMSRTRRPIWAKVPARWWVQLVLPTPPFWFSSVTMGMAVLSPGVGDGRLGLDLLGFPAAA